MNKQKDRNNEVKPGNLLERTANSDVDQTKGYIPYRAKIEPIKGNKMSDKPNVEQWLAIRKQAGLEIDPVTAEVDWAYGQTLDPYGIDWHSRPD